MQEPLSGTAQSTPFCPDHINALQDLGLVKIVFEPDELPALQSFEHNGLRQFRPSQP